MNFGDMTYLLQLDTLRKENDMDLISFDMTQKLTKLTVHTILDLEDHGLFPKRIWIDEHPLSPVAYCKKEVEIWMVRASNEIY